MERDVSFIRAYGFSMILEVSCLTAVWVSFNSIQFNSKGITGIGKHIYIAKEIVKLKKKKKLKMYNSRQTVMLLLEIYPDKNKMK